MTVLVLTGHEDDTATRVCAALDRLGADRVRMDLGDFPTSLAFTASCPGPSWAGWLSDGRRDVALVDITAVYWRRPTAFRMPGHLTGQHRRFAVAESRQGLGGVVATLPARFLNHPARIADAELKPAQLRAAAEIGFAVPPTLITSVAADARAFADRYGTVLYKPLTAAFLRADDSVRLVYATVITAEDIDEVSIGMTPCQFQVFIPKRHDVRLVAVGGTGFAVAIHAGSDAAYTDWRADYASLSYAPIQIPDAVADGVRTYLAHFGLAFGCFDFTVDHNGQWWFLECGANAQWGFLEAETGLPIAEAIARLLVGADR